MPNVDLQKVADRMQDITKRIAELNAEQDDLSTTLRVLKGLGYEVENLQVERSGQSTIVTGNVEFEGVSQADAAMSALTDSGKPMRARDITDALIAKGFPHTDASRLKNNLFTCMSRRTDLFEKVDAGLWALKEWNSGNDERTNSAS